MPSDNVTEWVIRRIIRNLLLLVLVTATMQSGLAQWTPYFAADVIRAEGMSSSPSSPKRETQAHGGLPDANAVAPPKDAHFGTEISFTRIPLLRFVGTRQ